MLSVGDVLESKSDGSFEIISNERWNKVCYKFKSGYTGVGTRQQVSRGQVKDYFKPVYFGVGFIGGRKYKTKAGSKTLSAYSRWKLMLKRCYDKSDEKYHNYGGAGVTVCDDWHNFQNYACWFYSNHKDGCDVDKDIGSSSNKIYSPETCSFVSHQENCDYSFAKTYMFACPEGNHMKIRNLNKFCRDNNLTPANMRKVLNGERSHHKGYRALQMNK